MGGREESAAGGGEAAEVDCVIVASVVLCIAGGAVLQPEEPFCEERRRLSARGRSLHSHGACPCQGHHSQLRPWALSLLLSCESTS